MNNEEAVMPDDTMERDRIEGEIRTLISSLDAPTSPIGDWKVVKIMRRALREIPTLMIMKSLQLSVRKCATA